MQINTLGHIIFQLLERQIVMPKVQYELLRSLKYQKKNLITIKIVSKSFLKSQVRSMVGCLKYLGEKKWSLKKFEEVLKSKNRQNCAPLAPPYGLYLEKITY